jgi:hypothetical protein
MAGEGGESTLAPGLHFAMGRLAMNVHGNADSHVDALCHVIFNRTLYNGVDPGTAAAGDGTSLSIDVTHDGIVDGGCCSTSPGCEACPGWSRATT